jgi:hypothetical protein
MESRALEVLEFDPREFLTERMRTKVGIKDLGEDIKRLAATYGIPRELEDLVGHCKLPLSDSDRLSAYREVSPTTEC